MNDTEEKDSVEVAVQPPKPEDLSSELAHSMNRLKGEIVKCIRVSANHYRCNWWGKPDGDLSDRIVRSTFVRATKTSDGLIVEDLTHARH